MGASVAWIQIAPVKGLALQTLTEVELAEDGPVGDRRFFLVDETARLVNAKGLGALQQVRPMHEAATGTLELHLPNGEVVSGTVELGDAIEAWASFWSRTVRVRLVAGPWAEVLSEFAGKPLRLVAAERPAVDRGVAGPVSLVSTAALDVLAAELGVTGVDGRRFRMHFGVHGTEPHAEDEWFGRRVAIGAAIVIPAGNVGRCAVTTQHPETGQPDLDTLKAIGRYRGEVETSEPLPFGIYGTVSSPGLVRLGDPIEP